VLVGRPLSARRGRPRRRGALRQRARRPPLPAPRSRSGALGLPLDLRGRVSRRTGGARRRDAGVVAAGGRAPSAVQAAGSTSLTFRFQSSSFVRLPW